MLPLQLTQHADAQALSLEALDQVGLSQRVQHYPKQLSGGEQQRVAIARAFATKPRILFADEPTGNLDNATGKVIIELLFKMNAEANTTLVLVTHDMELASRCQRQLQLDNGVLTDLV
jgi:putative ABC transport system ATP-binding protein